MLHIYINYPDSHITIHGNQQCSEIMKHQKKEGRVIEINPQSFSYEIEKFINGKHKFASESSRNDMWLIVDFDNIIFERNIVDFIHALLSGYTPFKGIEIEIEIHCKGNN